MTDKPATHPSSFATGSPEHVAYEQGAARLFSAATARARPLAFTANEDCTADRLDLNKAADALRILIRAYADDPQDVDWDDVGACLEVALEAFGLPADYVETAHAIAYPEEEA